ncbi:MAG TPA: hypothetical protein VEB60_01535, partial [Candidatus Paceibacterota bacterium]|nr:hypothetical protein [Candidatus Paceibacterota bacterium]
MLDERLTAQSLHHAYILTGQPEKVESELVRFIEGDLGRSIQGHPDVWIHRTESLGIDEGRLVRERQQGRPLVHSRRYFVLVVGGV